MLAGLPDASHSASVISPSFEPFPPGTSPSSDAPRYHTRCPCGGAKLMPRLTGWKRLLADADWCRRPGGFPLPAYSEFLPPPWVVVKPYSGPDPFAHQKSDQCGWNVSEYEEAHELRPGLAVIAREVLEEV